VITSIGMVVVREPLVREACAIDDRHAVLAERVDEVGREAAVVL